MKVAMGDFLSYLDLERGLSKNTHCSYEKDLLEFGDFVCKKQIADWTDVQAEHVSEWLARLNADGISARSVARKLSALHLLAKWLVVEGQRADDFCEIVSRPTIGKSVPEAPTEEEITRLLDAPVPATPQGLRDRAMLELMYSSGLRASEICGLELQSLNLEDGVILVHGKGNKERLVPVGKSAVKALTNYLYDEGGRQKLVKAKTGSAVFLSQWGRAISRKMLWVLVQEWTTRAGITKKIHPHELRHAFATHLLAHGADLRSIQEMLGHANISTTEIYTAVAKTRLIGEHARTHPLERKPKS
ncbi:MAG: tyrosine recombinase XerD [Opitutales bacterium]|nr:tyrosine recombinase XerD [Opitutales bacterium]